MKMTKQKFDSKSAKILNKSVTINISMSRNAKAIQEAQATLDQVIHLAFFWCLGSWDYDFRLLNPFRISKSCMQECETQIMPDSI